MHTQAVTNTICPVIGFVQQIRSLQKKTREKNVPVLMKERKEKEDIDCVPWCPCWLEEAWDERCSENSNIYCLVVFGHGGENSRGKYVCPFKNVKPRLVDGWS